jgi:hypothetical protein
MINATAVTAVTAITAVASVFIVVFSFAFKAVSFYKKARRTFRF